MKTALQKAFGPIILAILLAGSLFFALILSNKLNPAQASTTANLLTAVAFAILIATTASSIYALSKQIKKQHRLKQGRCLHCGYDLRASKHRCPECGTPSSNMGGGGSRV